MPKSKYFESDHRNQSCTHQRVTKVWGWGGGSHDLGFKDYLSILIDDKDIKNFEYTGHDMQWAFEQADKYLDSLNEKTCQSL